MKYNPERARNLLNNNYKRLTKQRKERYTRMALKFIKSNMRTCGHSRNEVDCYKCPFFINVKDKKGNYKKDVNGDKIKIHYCTIKVLGNVEPIKKSLVEWLILVQGEQEAKELIVEALL